MHVNISGQHLSLGEFLQDYAKDRLAKSVSKFFEQAVSGDVHFSKHGHEFFCTILVNEGTSQNLVIQSSSQSDDAYAAFDQALVKVEKQLRKYKEKIKNHHKKSHADLDAKDIKKLTFTKYTLDAKEEVAENPVVIAEKTTIIQTLTVAEAVMLMDLAELPAMVFINKSSGRVNFVYHRKDGNIAWVDPQVE